MDEGDDDDDADAVETDDNDEDDDGAEAEVAEVVVLEGEGCGPKVGRGPGVGGSDRCIWCKSKCRGGSIRLTAPTPSVSAGLWPGLAVPAGVADDDEAAGC